MTGKPRRPKAPYADTEVSVDASRVQIDRLLEENGAEAVSWATAWKAGKVALRFVVRTRKGQLVQFEVEPPSFTKKRSSWDPLKGRNVQQEEPNWPQSMRMLFFWLKAKFEGVRWGLREVEREFLNELIVTDREGRETTVGRLAERSLDSGEMALPQLADPNGAPIDAEHHPA